MARSTSSPVAASGTAVDAVPGRSLALNLLISLRPGQWTKNLLVFAGLLFGRRLFDPAAVARRGRGVRDLLRAVGRRLSGQRHRRSRQRSAASAQGAAADRVGRAAGAGRRSAPALVLGAGGARRRAFALGRAFGVGRRRLPRAAGRSIRAAEAHRHHRRADDRDRLRAARGGRRGRGRRRDQPLAAGLHDPAGAVHRAGEAAARDRAARRRRDQPPPDSRRVQRRICSIR